MTSALQEQIRLFLTALMFLTRVPCPKWIGYSESQINASCRYFPLVGALVGVAGVIVWYCARYFWALPVAVLLMMISTIILTGAFHEDGLSDTCDGFGGGWNRAQILTIMKDSRIGAYGVIGITLTLALKFFLCESLPEKHIAPAIIVAHAVSRFMATSFIFTHSYARDDDTSKIRPIAYRISIADFSVGCLTISIILMLIPECIIPIIIVCILGYFVMSRVLLRPLGGYTGDILGAVQQISELLVYFVIAANS